MCVCVCLSVCVLVGCNLCVSKLPLCPSSLIRASLYFCNPAKRPSPSIPSSIQGIWLPLRDGFLICVSECVFVCMWPHTHTHTHTVKGEEWNVKTQAHTSSKQLALLDCSRLTVQTHMGWTGWTHTCIFGQWPLTHMDATIWEDLQVCHYHSAYWCWLLNFWKLVFLSAHFNSCDIL